MTVCHILRINKDATVSTQLAIPTTTPGIYLTHTTTRLEHSAGWELRLRCGYSLGEQVFRTPTAAWAASAQLGALSVDWTADYLTLRRHFDAHPLDDHQARRVLAAAEHVAQERAS